LRNWLLLLFFLPTSLFAQSDLRYSASNLLRYGSGEERVSSFAQRRDYFENLTEAKITLSDFLIGFRLLYDAPPEFGVDFTGIKKRYLEFRKDDLYIRAGDSYTLYGRGLALNLFESRSLGFDTGLDGVKMEYQTRMVKIGFTAGDIHYLDILNLSRIEDYRIRAGSVELNPYRFVSLGVNIVSGKTPLGGKIDNSEFDIPEYFGKVSIGDVDAYASYAEKRTTVYNDTAGTHLGTAFYGALSFTEESFGISFEYKDYRFGITPPGPEGRDRKSNAKRAFAFQNPPTVHKEHTFTLLSRYPHVIDFSDEVGYQMDVFYTLFGSLTGSLNFSASSRHYSYDSTGVVPIPFTNLFAIKYGSGGRNNSWLPSFAAKYSPFWEVYGDLQYYLDEGGSNYIIIGLNRRSEDIADEVIIQPGHPQRSIKSTRSTAIPFAVQCSIGRGLVLKVTSERQWVYEDANLANKAYYNQLLSLALANSPAFSITLRYEFTSDFGTLDRRRDWTAIDTSYKLSDSHLVTLTVGGDRGGQVCANGVCRIVNPFLGVRASITSYL
jgi:Family of unknown function (DUF6029)